ncbi:hypothetical protein MLD38_004092 [Melastoma candidum]|uniref:Uncharacterized protein n=1 Tax=Melastoma candidum TaxID=119954 RepID=A0ACB9S5Z3_9MYRT|nr:hypothetical protein MLD38_004092 [Melastoma candidum]
MIPNMVYLHRAICESLRLYPPVTLQHKVPIKPVVLLSGHRIHPGNKVLIPLYVVGGMKSIWGEDSLEVKPERWIPERGSIRPEPSYKFLLFNAGPRSCLGREVAL